MSTLQVAVVPNVPFIEFSRDFDAPVSAVSRAHADPDGAKFEFHGVFHAARPVDLITQICEYDGCPDVVSIETVRFVDLGDGCMRLIGHSTYPSQEARDGMADSGLEEGMTQDYERLDNVLTELMATR